MLKEKLLRTREEVLSRIEEIKKEKTIAITDAASLASITNEEDLTTFAKEIVKLLTKKTQPSNLSILEESLVISNAMVLSSHWSQGIMPH